MVLARHAAVVFGVLAVAEGCHISTGPRPAAQPYPVQRMANGQYVPPAPPPPAPPPMAYAPPTQAPLAAPPPPAPNGPNAPAGPVAAGPPGWTSMGGLMVPLIPGITGPGAPPFPSLGLP